MHADRSKDVWMSFCQQNSPGRAFRADARNHERHYAGPVGTVDDGLDVVLEGSIIQMAMAVEYFHCLHHLLTYLVLIISF